MDPPTHGLLGAALGQAFFGRTLGRRALLWGAVGGMLPDVDIVMTATGPMGEWLYHRGVTHALCLPPLVGPLLGALVWRRERRRDPDRPPWSTGRMRAGRPAAETMAAANSAQEQYPSAARW